VVFPLKDTLPGERPPVLTLGLIAGLLLAALAVPGAGWSWSVPGALLVLWLFGATLEDAPGRPALLGLAAAGGAAGLLGAASPAGAAAGAASAVLGAYLVAHPRGRVLCASFVPFFLTMLEVPVLLIGAVWAGVLALTAAPALPAAVAAFAAGLVAGRVLGGRPRRAPSPYRMA
jgi:membrane associated rhomboid family serine protease